MVAPPATAPLEMAPGIQVLSKVPVPAGDNVVFLTIDDGMVRKPEFTERFIAAGIPVTIFPVATAIKSNPEFFRTWMDNGAALGNHTVNHPNLKKLGLADQTREICDASATAEQLLGSKPLYFRPPYGNHNQDTNTAMQQCGYRYLLLWHAAVNNGQVQFQGGAHLQAGDIILMHFRETFDADFDAVIAQAKADGMRFGVLGNYLPA